MVDTPGANKKALTSGEAALDSPSTFRVLGCSYGAASAACFITYPLDTVKTLLQTHEYPTFWKCIRETYNDAGVSAFYKGIPASLISSAVARSINMSLYAKFKVGIANALSMSSPDSFVPIFSGALIAGSFSCIITGPLEFTKVASQVENLVYKQRGLEPPRHRSSTLQAVKGMIRRGGIPQLYGGVEYHLLRDSLGSAIYFTVYEYVKRGMSRILPVKPGEPPHPLSVITAGAVCGVAAWAVIFPIDTMKSTYQKDLYFHSLANSMEFYDTVVSRPEFKWSLSMYRGFGFSVLRTSLNGVTLFGVYEWLMWMTAPKKESTRMF